MITYRDFVPEFYDDKGLVYMRASRNDTMQKPGFSLYWVHLPPEVRARRIQLPRNGDEIVLEPVQHMRERNKHKRHKKVAKFILVGRRATGYVQFYEIPL